MSKRILVVLIAVLGVVVLIAGLNGLQNRNQEESSEEVSGMVTEVIIVPSEMPDRISLELPPGFEEKHSEAYDKYFVRDDASVIVTGEKMTIKGIRLDEYTASVKKQYEQTADNYTLIQEQTLSLSGGTQGTLLEFVYSIIGTDVRQDMQCVTAVIVKDDRSYIVTCKSKKETFSVYRASFLRMIEHITIADADSEETTPSLG